MRQPTHARSAAREAAVPPGPPPRSRSVTPDRGVGHGRRVDGQQRHDGHVPQRGIRIFGARDPSPCTTVNPGFTQPSATDWSPATLKPRQVPRNTPFNQVMNLLVCCRQEPAVGLLLSRNRRIPRAGEPVRIAVMVSRIVSRLAEHQWGARGGVPSMQGSLALRPSPGYSV